MDTGQSKLKQPYPFFFFFFFWVDEKTTILKIGEKINVNKQANGLHTPFGGIVIGGSCWSW